MATLAALNPEIVNAVAAQAAALLDGNPRFRQAVAAPPLATIHEYFPVWLLGADALDRLRRDRFLAVEDFELLQYLQKSSVWLYQLHRSGQPIGYVLAHADATGHRVTEVAETAEAGLLALAIASLDQATSDDACEACILDCPALGVAALLLVSDARARQACVFRNSAQSSDSSPGLPLAVPAFIDLLLEFDRRRDAAPIRSRSGQPPPTVP